MIGDGLLWSRSGEDSGSVMVWKANLVKVMVGSKASVSIREAWMAI